MIQTRWRKSSDFPTLWLVHFGGWASFSEPYKPPLSNKGGTKNKRQYTLTSGKRCIYKVKPHFTWRDINYAIITMKNWIRHKKDSWFQIRNWLSFFNRNVGNYQYMVVAFFNWRNLKMNDKNFIEELRQKREKYGVTQTSINIYYN